MKYINKETKEIFENPGDVRKTLAPKKLPKKTHIRSRTYIHGILDNEAVLQEILQIVRPGIRVRADYAALKEKGFDQLADLLRRHIDLPHIYQLLQK